MTEETIFSKIIRREVPADIVYQDDLVTAFRDINPQAPVHILVVPNRRIIMASTVEEDDRDVLGQLFIAARRVAEQEGLERGYRLIVNSGEHAHMEVPHLHVHILGGEPLGPLLARR